VSNQSATRLSDRSEQAAARVDLISRLFLQFSDSRSENLRERVQVYLQDTSDIPQAWLEVALKSFVGDAERTFVPSLAEVRTRVAREYLTHVRALRARAGENPSTPKTALDVESTIARLAREAPGGLDQLKALEAGRGLGHHGAPGKLELGTGDPYEVLGSIDVVDESGERVPLPQLMDRIFSDGVYVPAGGGMRARWLASLAAARQLGQPTRYHRLTRDEWMRADGLMTQHASVSNADTAWWFGKPGGERFVAWAAVLSREESADGR
jgi:hypothetical protein